MNLRVAQGGLGWVREVLARRRVWTQYVAPTCDGKPFSAGHTSVTGCSAEVSISWADMGASTWVGGDHCLALPIVRTDAIGTLLLQEQDLVLEVARERSTALLALQFFLAGEIVLF